MKPTTCYTISIVITLGVIMMTSAFNAPSQNHESTVNKELIYKAFTNWQKGNNNFFDLLAENVVWTVSGTSIVSKTYRSKTDFIQHAVMPINAKLTSRIKPEFISLSAEGSTVWLHWKGSARAKSGITYHNEYAWKLEIKNGKITGAIAFLDTKELDLLLNNQLQKMKTIEETKEYIGMWKTADGLIRHELLPDNRYDEARGLKESAYQGSYLVSGNHIDYKDDTGFRADGDFKDGVLYHGGMVFYKAK